MNPVILLYRRRSPKDRGGGLWAVPVFMQVGRNRCHAGESKVPRGQGDTELLYEGRQIPANARIHVHPQPALTRELGDFRDWIVATIWPTGRGCHETDRIGGDRLCEGIGASAPVFGKRHP